MGHPSSQRLHATPIVAQRYAGGPVHSSPIVIRGSGDRYGADPKAIATFRYSAAAAGTDYCEGASAGPGDHDFREKRRFDP